jgi:hypothetical protein
MPMSRGRVALTRFQPRADEISNFVESARTILRIVVDKRRRSLEP